MRGSVLTRHRNPERFAQEQFAKATRLLKATTSRIHNQIWPAFPTFDFGPNFNVAELASHQPPRYRPIRRFRYYWHLKNALKQSTNEHARSRFEREVAAFHPSWSAADFRAWAGALAAAIIGAWAFVWPCVGVPLLLLLGWGAAPHPTVKHYDERLLPLQPDELVSAMSSDKDFVVLEGPKGTAKTTMIQLASRAKGVPCPLYLHVNYRVSESHYILRGIAQRFWIAEAQANMTLHVLRAIGRPLHLFIDIEGNDVDLVQLTKHAKSLIADAGQPLLRAAIASSDRKTALLRDPRMIRISTKEVDVATATRYLEAQGCDVPSELLARHPRTPLGLERLKREFDARGHDGVRRFVDQSLVETQRQVKIVFDTCVNKKTFLLMASQPNREFDLSEVRSICGKSFDFTQDEKWVREAVLNYNLFRPENGGFVAQFDQRREACRRVAESLPRDWSWSRPFA